MATGGSHTVLIVYGERPTPGLLPRFLRHPAIRLVTAGHDDSVFRKAAERRPGLIIEDCPDDNGHSLEFCLRLRADAATAQVPLILVAPPQVAPIPPAARPDVLVGRPIVQREYYEAVARFVPLPQRSVVRHAVNLRFLYKVDGVSGQAFSRDLSVQGAFLKTDRTIEPGAHLELQFGIPGQVEPVRCGGVVRSSEPFELNSARAGFGVEFEGIAEIDIERLEDFIERQLDRPLFSF